MSMQNAERPVNDMKRRSRQILKSMAAFVMILTLVITPDTIVLAEEIKEQAEEAFHEYKEEQRR